MQANGQQMMPKFAHFLIYPFLRQAAHWRWLTCVFSFWNRFGLPGMTGNLEELVMKVFFIFPIFSEICSA
jgi:hypothetical protein